MTPPPSPLPFWKMSGAGNDFVVLEDDGRLDGRRLAPRLCDRREGVGADGLLLIRPGPHHRVVYFNADGSRAFCGNGARCAALWLSGRPGVGRHLSFRSDEGVLEAEVRGGGRVRVRMPEPTAPSPKTAEVGARAWKGWSVDTGVPHFVVPVRALEKVPVAALGGALRRHKAFGKAGTNVDFVVWGRTLKLRTYERGVEAETFACGTGAVAAALAAEASGRATLPVSVGVVGGALLTVSRGPDGAVWLEGPAAVTFEGRFDPRAGAW